MTDILRSAGEIRLHGDVRSCIYATVYYSVTEFVILDLKHGYGRPCGLGEEAKICRVVRKMAIVRENISQMS